MRVSIGSYGAALALVFLATGCGSDSGAKDMIAGLTEARDAMKSIKDEATAKEAQPKLKAAGEKYKAGMTKMLESKKDPPEDQQKQIKDLMKEVQEETVKVMFMPGGMDALKDFMEALKTGGKK
jgi:hypothetical protein